MAINRNMMKGYWMLLLLGVFTAACHQEKTIKLRAVKIDSAENQGFIVNKAYTDAELTDGLENGFAKTLTLRQKDGNIYFVSFSSSENPVNQKSCCKYRGWGTLRNDSIFVDLVNYQEPITLVISHGLPESIQPELLVNTLDKKDKDRLKDFCCSGKTLAGTYVLRTPLSSDE